MSLYIKRIMNDLKELEKELGYCYTGKGVIIIGWEVWRDIGDDPRFGFVKERYGIGSICGYDILLSSKLKEYTIFCECMPLFTLTAKYKGEWWTEK